MLISKKDLIFQNLYDKKINTFESEIQNYKKLSNIFNKNPDEIIEIVKKSNLRGRGGAGFSTGTKWSFMPKNPVIKPNYLVINADESEPGTCKDRSLIEYESHKIIQGAIIASYALRVKTCYIYIRGEFFDEAKILEKAITDCRKNNFLGENILNSKISLDIVLHKGAGAYICGEETALLESLEGKKGFPRLKPPFPAVYGLYGCPTTVNNVESIAILPSIIEKGADWFLSLGPSKSPGVKLFCISGSVNNPCVVEQHMGVSLKYLIETYAKGVIGGWDNLKAIIPGGSSSKILPKLLCENLFMDFESLKVAGSSLGTGGIIVINKQVNVVNVIETFSKFYMHESCGQCSPCREGTGFVWRIIDKICKKQGKLEDLALLLDTAKKLESNTICALSDAASIPPQGLLEHFMEDVKKLIL